MRKEHKRSHAIRTTRIESFKKWLITQHWIETVDKRYVQPSPLEAHQKTYYTRKQLNDLYNSYVQKVVELQKIEKLYKLHLKSFECTINTWYDVDSLGVTIHHETKGIYSEQYLATTSSEARYRFKRNSYDDNIEYQNIRARRNPHNDLWILHTTDIFQWQFADEEIQKMMNATGNSLNEKIKGYRNRYQSSFDQTWETLISRGLAEKTESNGLNYYSLNYYGLAIVTLLLPTQNREYHFRNITLLQNAGFIIDLDKLKKISDCCLISYKRNINGFNKYTKAGD